VGLHDLEFFDGQFAGLEQDGIRYADLANIVQRGRLNEGVDLIFRQIGRKAVVTPQMFGQSTDIELGAADVLTTYIYYLLRINPNGLVSPGCGVDPHNKSPSPQISVTRGSVRSRSKRPTAKWF
jgi:hypothetical protein